MSILIKSMEMPKSCYSCNFCQYYAEPNQGCYCVALFADLHRTNFVKERLKNCPLIEVPTSYGRLIDADKLLRLLQFNKDVINVFWFEEVVRDAPTVIESEK